MNTKIFLAAVSQFKNKICPNYEPTFILESYMYLKAKTDCTKRYMDWCSKAEGFLLDSGAFTFMNKTSTADEFPREKLIKYIDDYIEFINTWDIQHFFEMDIDCVIGYENVKRIRAYIEEGTGKKAIPVWHITRGVEEFHNMCKEYDYVSIGGIASREIKPSEHQILFDLCDVAHSYGCTIHGLGYLRTKVLNNRECPFDTVDGTSWSSRMDNKSFDVQDGKLVKFVNDVHWSERIPKSYEAWNEFAKLKDVYNPETWGYTKDKQ